MTPRLINSAVVILLAEIAGSIALAADVPVQNASLTPLYGRPSAFDWTGFYFGGDVGANITSNYNADTEGNTTFQFNNNYTGIVPITLDTGTGGAIGGVEAGYNYQYGSFVGGVEGDVSSLQAGGGSGWTSASTLLGSTFTTTASVRLDYLATLRLRFGYTPYDRWLIFATGGLAVGGVQNSSKVVMDTTPADTWGASSNETRSGYVVGGGVEYLLTQNIAVKGEYLYYNIGSKNSTAYGNATVAADPALNQLFYVNKTTTAGSIMRIGVNYKF